MTFKGICSCDGKKQIILSITFFFQVLALQSSMAFAPKAETQKMLPFVNITWICKSEGQQPKYLLQLLLVCSKDRKHKSIFPYLLAKHNEIKLLGRGSQLFLSNYLIKIIGIYLDF